MQQKLLSIMTCAILGLGFTNSTFADTANSNNLNEPPAINLKLYILGNYVTGLPENKITPTDSFCSGPCGNKIDLSLAHETTDDVLNLTTYADLYYRSSQVVEWVENQQKGLPKSPFPTFKPKELSYAYKFDLKLHGNFSTKEEDLICPNLVLAQGHNEKYGNNLYLFSNYQKGFAVQNGHTYYQTYIVCHPINDPTKNEIFNAMGDEYDYGALELIYFPGQK